MIQETTAVAAFDIFTWKVAADPLTSHVGLVSADRPQDMGVGSYLWVVNLWQKKRSYFLTILDPRAAVLIC